MTVLHNKKQNSIKHSHRRMQVIGSVTCIAAGAVIHSLSGRYIKTPRSNSRLSCPQWVQELLDGHRDRFRDVHKLNRHVFENLLDELKRKAGLQHSRHLSAKEQLAIFLYICTTGLSNHKARDACLARQCM